VRVLVASEADEASAGQRAALLALAAWEPEAAFEGRPAYRRGDLWLISIAEHHLYRDHLDRDVAAALGEPPDLIVYLSKHRSESRTASLTVHPIGNPKGADFGGQPGTLVPAAPRWMTAALRQLRAEARGLPYEVTFEATHHGPYLETPTFYIEQGSTEKEWGDAEASAAIARTLLDLSPADVPVAIATDHNPGTSPLVGMPAALALAVNLCGLTPPQAIVAATINGAHALGRGDRTGALVKGRRADIVVLATDDERELAYALGAQLVARVFAAGRALD